MRNITCLTSREQNLPEQRGKRPPVYHETMASFFSPVTIVWVLLLLLMLLLEGCGGSFRYGHGFSPSSRYEHGLHRDSHFGSHFLYHY